MASLTQLKENGQFVDKWMGLFYDGDFYNYKSILAKRINLNDTDELVESAER